MNAAETYLITGLPFFQIGELFSSGDTGITTNYINDYPRLFCGKRRLILSHNNYFIIRRK